MVRDLEAWWGSPDLLTEVDAWAAAVLGWRGLATTGPAVAHRIRFWSAVFRVPTEAGTFWVKAASPGQGFEIALTTALADLVPEHVLTPLATVVDPEHDRFWMLLPDGGTTLRDHGGATTAHWCRLVRDLAELQRALVPHGDRLRVAGLPPLSAADGVAYVERMIAWGRSLDPADPQHLGAAQEEELHADLPRLRADLALLAASGVPDSLQHNDASDNNAFVTGPDGLGPLRFFDLGDAFWSHPFAALQLTLCFATGSYPWPDTSSELATAVVDAYLGCWPEHGSVAELRPLVTPALRLAQVHRTESWRRLLAVVPDRPDGTLLLDVLRRAVAEHPQRPASP